MKKLSSRILALSLALVMLAALFCIPASAAYVSTLKASADIGSVAYRKYAAVGDGGTGTAVLATFNPTTNQADGYVAMPFIAWAGSRSTLNNYYAQATGSRYNYDVAAIINGGFFDMSSGTLGGTDIWGGMVRCGTDRTSGKMLVFNSDGTAKVVDSAITFDLNLNGTNFSGAIQHVNKVSSTTYGCFMYYDSACGTACDSKTAGYEIVCNKVGGTELFVDRDLIGEIVEIRTNTYGGAVGANQFVLWLPYASTEAGENYQAGLANRIAAVKNLKVGDEIRINARETVDAAKPILEECLGAISCAGVLVENGVDLTKTNSTIGTHAVNAYYRGWTNIGIKADGTMIFMVSSEEDCFDQQNCAQVLIDLGCKDVVRFDGGGSSAMYVKNTGSGSAGFGYYVSSEGTNGRSVSDGIMIVKRSSMRSDAKKSELGTLINKLSPYFSVVGEPAVLTKARTIYNAAYSVDADYQRAILDLQAIDDTREILKQISDVAAAVDADTVSDRKGDWLQKVVADATAIYNNAAATEAEISTQINKINDIFRSTLAGERISLGAAYDYGTVFTAYPDTGKLELTDGNVFGDTVSSSAWTGFRKANAVGKDATGSYTEIYLDLGEIKSATGAMLSSYKSSLITAPKAVKVLASQDGENFAEYLTLAEENYPAYTFTEGNIQYEAMGSIKARYFVFRVYFSGSNLFVGEASIYGDETVAESGIDAFDGSIVEGAVKIFSGKPSGVINSDVTNAAWSKIITVDYSDELSAYVVTDSIFPNGSTDYEVIVPTNGFVLVMHGDGWDRVKNDFAIGYIVLLNGVDLVNKTLKPCASVAFVAPPAAITRKDVVAANVFMNKNIATVDGRVISVKNGITSEDLMSAYIGSNGSLTFNGSTVDATAVVGTGAIFMDDGANYTTCVRGDLSGDGKTTAIDYLILKRGMLGRYTLSVAQNKAGALTNGENATVIDYVMMKRAVLGSYSI